MGHIKRSIQLPLDHSFFLFGARQTGKTTILKHRFTEANSLTYDLLNYNLIRRFEKDPELFFQEVSSRNTQVKYVIVDEVQKLPWILDEVHRLIENSKNPPYFILTGSSSRKLKKSDANMLAGRAIEKTLFPLIYQEIAKLEEKPFFLEEVLHYGSLPSVYLAQSKELKYEILRAYTNTYLKEEIKEEALVRNLGAFNEFLILASEENGNTLNYSNLAQDIGVSLKTVKEYYQILIDTLMGFLLMPTKRSVRQQISKSPRFYFFDTGIPRALLEKLQSPLIPGTKEYGKVFEHWLIKEIIHKANLMRRDYRFSFYRVNDEIEVDLIIDKPNGETMAIEIKSTENPKINKLKGLKSFSKVAPEAKLICACRTRNRVIDPESNIVILPWQELLESL